MTARPYRIPHWGAGPAPRAVAESMHRAGLLLGAAVFLAAGKGEELSGLAVGLGALFALLLLLSLAGAWRVLGDTRKGGAGFWLICLWLVLSAVFARSIDPPPAAPAEGPPTLLRLGGVVASHALSALLVAALALAVARATRPGRPVALGWAVVLGVGPSLWRAPEPEWLAGVAFAALFAWDLHRPALLLPENVEAALDEAQRRFLLRLREAGGLSLGESRLLLAGDGARLLELVDFELAVVDRERRRALPGPMLEARGDTAPERALAVARAMGWGALALAYVVMPDLVPGPLDDALVALVAAYGGALAGWMGKRAAHSEAQR
ncbi:MAG: hypothetical protein SF028_09040 [Candidatus Sumerlaeia bacterium]|nr:hypothetical protein [Candidatus Sumerlaeia bacterium]